MVSLLALAAAVAITFAVGSGPALTTGLVLLAIGAVPALAALGRRGGGALTGVVPLHVGSFLAQAGLITVLIAVIPG